MTSVNSHYPKPIKRLDEIVVNRISAGEVIHRPLNVVKELVENSMDAKANRIEITVKEGGLKSIVIEDNGIGIKREDLDIVCERFTTSKLQDVEDLLHLQSYGFRGEALAAISHISYVSIVSKTESQLTGFKEEFVDGKAVGRVTPMAANRGTIVTVENLFYNMTTRKNALTSAANEYKLIVDLITKYSVHYSNKISFTLRKSSDNCDVNSNLDNTLEANIRQLYGSDIANNLIELSIEDKNVLNFSLKGFISNQNIQKSSFAFILFINDRLVESNVLKKAISLVYESVLMKGCHPFVYLSIKIDCKNIDVNIHPTKSEVRFLNEEQICQQIVELIGSKLSVRDTNRLAINQSVVSLSLTPKSNDSTQQRSTPKTTNSVPKESVNHSPRLSTPVRPSKQVRTDCKDRRLEEFVDISNTNVKTNRKEFKYKSLSLLRESVQNESDRRLQDMIVGSSYVGCVDEKHILIQFEEQLILTDAYLLNVQLFYQLYLISFGNFSSIVFSKPSLISDLVEPYIEYKSSRQQTIYYVEEIVSTLVSKKDMLSEYFAINISDDKRLKTLPQVLDNFVPNMANIGEFLCSLATEVDWSHEKECFESIGRVLAQFYAKPRNKFETDSEHQKWAKVMESTVYPKYKSVLCPPKSLAKGSTFVLTVINDLYKVFERC